MSISVFTKRHPVLTYFTLVFAISWGGILLVIGGPGGIPGTPEQTKTLFPFVYLTMLAGPSIAGILLTGLVYGRAGFHEFLSRLLRRRVGTRYYVVALLTAPFLMTAVPLLLSLLSPEFLPGIFTFDGKADLLLFGLVVGLGAGILEEIGWTGLAIPGLRLRFGVFATGLIVGMLWGLWHFLVNFWASGTSTGAFSLTLLLPMLLASVGVLPAYRVLMVWVYDRTGSLLVAMFMHMSLTASTIIFSPLAPLTSGGPILTNNLVLAAALWVVVAVVAVAKGGRLSRQPFRSLR